MLRWTLQELGEKSGVNFEVLAVDSLTDLQNGKLNSKDQIIGFLFNAHGDPRKIYFERDFVTGEKGRNYMNGIEFAGKFDSVLKKLEPALSPKIFVHFMSCSLSGYCRTSSRKNFIDDFSSVAFREATALRRELLVTSFDFNAGVSTLGTARQVREATKASPPLKVLLKWLEHKRSFAIYDGIKRRKGLDQILSWNAAADNLIPSAALVISISTLAFSYLGAEHWSLMDGMLAWLAKNMFIDGYKSTQARLLRANGDVQIEHIQRLLTQVLYEVDPARGLHCSDIFK